MCGALRGMVAVMFIGTRRGIEASIHTGYDAALEGAETAGEPFIAALVQRRSVTCRDGLGRT